MADKDNLLPRPPKNEAERKRFEEDLIVYLREMKVEIVSITAMPVSDPPTQAEITTIATNVQDIGEKLNELIKKIDT
jgi:hypothetical protein